jgi:hypothetical protein
MCTLLCLLSLLQAFCLFDISACFNVFACVCLFFNLHVSLCGVRVRLCMFLCTSIRIRIVPTRTMMKTNSTIPSTYTTVHVRIIDIIL